jgi:pyridoxine 5-phosphate synthase
VAALLSVNVNKYALVRNSRGRNSPDLLAACDACLEAGAHGITVHPRLDQRHVRLDDVPAIGAHLAARWPGVEFNVECQPDDRLIDLVLAVGPTQCTLVPVRPGEVTSDHGFDLPLEGPALKPLIGRLHAGGVRVSLFVDCDPVIVRAARDTGADRVELYTGPYAWAWGTPDQEARRAEVFAAARAAGDVGICVL